MKRLTIADYTAMPWKNGGGTTHEIAAQYDGERLLWRLSTARVETDGPYSRFPGLTRISAVVEGHGTRLIDTETGKVTLIAPMEYAEFSGDQSMRGELVDGGIRHLNVLYDPARIAAKAQLVRGPFKRTISPDGATSHALYSVGMSIRMQDASLNPGETGLITPAENVKISAVTGAAGLWISLRSL